jgi:hypothetical protein
MRGTSTQTLDERSGGPALAIWWRKPEVVAMIVALVNTSLASAA